MLGLTQEGVGKVRLEVLGDTEGERAHARQKRILEREGVTVWSEKEFAELDAGSRGDGQPGPFR